MAEREIAETIIKARSPLLVKLFSAYVHWYLSRNFHGIRVSLTGPPPNHANKPLIIYSNHPSWWDPLLFQVLSARCFPTQLAFGPMDSVALEKYGFMKRLGVFGVALNSYTGTRSFLRTATAILANPETSLWVTAQGEFSDSRKRPLDLRPGIAHLTRLCPDLVLLPLAIEYPFWDERYPEALVRFGAPCFGTQLSDLNSTQALSQLESNLMECMDRLMDESLTRNANLFETLIDGSVGVGGVYQAFKKFKARLKGERYNPAHGSRDP